MRQRVNQRLSEEYVKISLYQCQHTASGSFQFLAASLMKILNRLDGIGTEIFRKKQKEKSSFLVCVKGSRRFVSFQASGEERATAFQRAEGYGSISTKCKSC